MHIHHISRQNSVLNTFLSEIRDVHTQKDPLRFRKNIERIGEILGYEMSKTLNFQKSTTKTPLGNSSVQLISENLVLCSILRAGIPLHNGLLNYFDRAENAFISAYRQHDEDSNTFKILVEYLACPDLNGKTLVLADPMLATGQSLVSTFEALKPYGIPKKTNIVSIIGSKKGVAFVNDYFDKNTDLWIAAIDNDLNEKGYIVPGLGDAGDLAFGEKLQQ
ncbi:uracil phosphoribosyltransferase [Cognatitamlana onchidii]|uniref:uracil phosphoribosyltransferase n=1 Tax=Cognatitamlana onchidii TaxID=2562860 RepID=UPI0010A6854B|nr:uracil phosphoribosyltransferase [Algibacter onchidii]